MAPEAVPLADRLPLETFKRPDVVDRWKQRLGLTALAAGGVWLAVTLLSPAALPLYAPGPLAHAHAPWEENCWACHKEFSPVSSDHWTRAGAASPSDKNCQTCHAGPPHHANDNPAAAPGCAACHRDHQGRQTSLVRLSEACIRCHRDLAAHAVDPGKVRTTLEVKRFTDDHPDFKRAARGADEGKLRFDHKLHMAPGLTLPDTEYQAMNFSLHRIPPKYRDAYRQPGQKDHELVRLECRSCHRPDGEGDPDARARGAYMQPVRYEQHCAACHRLTYDSQAPSDPESGPPTVPHGVQPGALREYLE